MTPHFREVRDQLQAYFEGELHQFEIPIRLVGTEFQRRVWKELINIPFGTTISYAEQARRIGRAGSARAVGSANGRNPIAIVVPCHRVIGANGTLTGYGGGLELQAMAARSRDECRSVTIRSLIRSGPELQPAW